MAYVLGRWAGVLRKGIIRHAAEGARILHSRDGIRTDALEGVAGLKPVRRDLSSGVFGNGARAESDRPA